MKNVKKKRYKGPHLCQINYTVVSIGVSAVAPTISLSGAIKNSVKSISKKKIAKAAPAAHAVPHKYSLSKMHSSIP